MLDNMQMWFSFDQDMPKPPRIKGFPQGYLSIDDLDHPPRGTDLVFRDQRATILKRAKYSTPVCPYDNGVTGTTCSHCQLCFRQDKLAKAKRSLRKDKSRSELRVL
jgi:hypothetical protein